MLSMTFSGVTAYPVTPLHPGGALDLDSLECTVARLAHSGVSGIVVLGTSGLFAYLDAQERADVVRTAVRAASGSGVPVGVGISAITTREVLQLAYSAENNGADGLVLSPVSYIPLVSQEIADQVETVASAVSLPLCLYNNPSTTGFTYPVELAAELSWLDNVVAFKDTAASGRLFHSRQLLFAQQSEPGTVHGASRDQLIVDEHPDAAWHSGMAALLAPEFVAFHEAVTQGRTEDAAAWSRALRPLMQLMGHERPLSVLYALAEVCGVRTSAPRRPLLPIPSHSRDALATAVARLRETAPSTTSR
ncbi:dihydrodipicolinate synthase family protein [Kocuria salsicia]|uniref:dihydrodipicolinate synthase family protein n=1 Tax=Kocuria salsicia TaxID=664639 RepID=UPI0011A5B85A|nr:dihydrodipicolinate synthase family protein [Kocuria salsicia]MBS6029478.1 dihydrodipicolinate synthase family protein [Kocuria rhizophila]